MKICIFGAGGVGGYLAAKLAQAGTDEVSVIARGEHLQKIKRDGLRLICAEGEQCVRFAAAEQEAQRLPPQDIVFVTLKAHSQAAVATDLNSLLKPEGHAVFVTNGVPWWWNYGLGVSAEPLPRLDPQGLLWNRFGPARALGCVVYSVNEVTTPGTVLHLGNNRWIVGEPSGQTSQRLERTTSVMARAGLNAEISSDLRAQVWGKLLRNVPFNALAALTRLSAADFAGAPCLIELAQTVTDEVIRVASAKGWQLPAAKAIDVVSSGGFIDGAKLQANGKASMLHDVLLGRPTEFEAILGQVQQFGREENVPTPTLDVLYALLSGLEIHLRQSSGAPRPVATPAAAVAG